MFPVPRLAAEVEREWSEELASHFRCLPEALLANPRALMAYPTAAVRIELMDGSFAEFKCAFFVVSEHKKAIAIFTEHCGHHVFPYHVARVYTEGVLRYAQQGA
jgi:hypothetical protein